MDPDVPDHQGYFFVCELCAESVYDHIFSHVSPPPYTSFYCAEAAAVQACAALDALMVSMTWGCFTEPEIAPTGHSLAHLVQPRQSSDRSAGSPGPLHWLAGHFLSITWARYSSRKYFRVLLTGDGADFPRPQRAVSEMVEESSSRSLMCSRVPRPR